MDGVPHNDKQASMAYHREVVRRFTEAGPSAGLLVSARRRQKGDPPAPPPLIVNGRAADVRARTRPIFTAYRYGVTPQWAFTLNPKDVERYRNLSALTIYLWADWHERHYHHGHESRWLGGVWAAPVWKLEGMLRTAPEHAYEDRYEGDGHSASSLILDLRQFDAVVLREGTRPAEGTWPWLLPPPPAPRPRTVAATGRTEAKRENPPCPRCGLATAPCGCPRQGALL